MHRIIEEDSIALANIELPWEMLKGKTILISGANGYVSAYFIHAFLRRNELFDSQIKVIALCRSEQRAKERFCEYLGRTDFQLLLQDVCEPINLNERIDFFIHAASPANISTRANLPASTFLTNVFGCKNLLDAALRNKGAKLLFLSSVDVYYGQDIYSCAKRATETLCTAYNAEYGMDALVARPYQVIGPGIALSDGRLHANFANQLKNTGKIIINTDGKAKRTFLYITDAIYGMLLVLLKGKTSEVYDVCSETGDATVIEFAKIFAKNASIEVGNIPTASPSCVTGSSQKLRDLGWKPNVSLEKAVERFLEFNCVLRIQ
jgi:nucleoside-diphosphate-sugar epimerase